MSLHILTPVELHSANFSDGFVYKSVFSLILSNVIACFNSSWTYVCSIHGSLCSSACFFLFFSS